MNNLPISPKQDATGTLLSKKELKTIRIAAPTALFILGLIILCGILLGDKNSSNNIADIKPTQTPSPTSTPTLSPTPVLELIPVEYQILITDTNTPVPLRYWFTNADEEIVVGSENIRESHPFTHTIQIESDKHIELSGIVVNNSDNRIVCRILVRGVLIEQSTSHGNGTGIYCSGIVLKTE